MSWCDKVGSTPSVGIQLTNHFATSAVLLEAFSPILDKHVEKDKPAFTIDEADNFSLAVNTHDGFRYGVDQRKVHVTFNHRMRPKNVSGQAPTMEMLSESRPYTQMLPITWEKLHEAALLLPKRKDRQITRIGVVSNTVVDESLIPPGIEKLLKWIGQPWGKLTDAFSIQITTEIDKKPGWTDRCVHTLLRTEYKDDLLTLMFDYQRTFKITKPIQSEVLKEISSEIERSALRYLEDLAEGNRFDEIDSSNVAG